LVLVELSPERKRDGKANSEQKRTRKGGPGFPRAQVQHVSWRPLPPPPTTSTPSRTGEGATMRTPRRHSAWDLARGRDSRRSPQRMRRLRPSHYGGRPQTIGVRADSRQTSGRGLNVGGCRGHSACNSGRQVVQGARSSTKYC
jgi:hypothetical protein